MSGKRIDDRKGNFFFVEAIPSERATPKENTRPHTKKKPRKSTTVISEMRARGILGSGRHRCCYHSRNEVSWCPKHTKTRLQAIPSMPAKLSHAFIVFLPIHRAINGREHLQSCVDKEEVLTVCLARVAVQREPRRSE